MVDDNEHIEKPLIGLFANLKETDRVARGLISLGLTEDQIELVDLTRLIAEYDPEFAEIALGADRTKPTDLDDELIESFGLKIVEEIDLPQYLIDLGVPEHATPYYASKIRDDLVMLIVTPGEEYISDANRLLNEMKLQDPT